MNIITWARRNASRLQSLTPFQEHPHRLRECPVLLAQDPRGEAPRRVAGLHRDRPLKQDGAGVIPLANQVDRAAAHPHPGAEHRPVDAQPVHALASEQRQERRMDIEDPTVKFSHDRGREFQKPPGHGDDVDATLPEQAPERRPVGPRGRECARLERHRLDTGAPRPGERAHPGPVAHDKRDADSPARGAASGKRVQKRLEIAPSPRREHRDSP